MSPVSMLNIKERVLHLAFAGNLTLDDMKRTNQQVTDALQGADQKLILVLDTSDLSVGYSTVDHLRNTQLYRDHEKLETIVVIANNPLNRLISLLVFSLSRARLIQFDNEELAQQYIDRRAKLLGRSS